MHINIITLKFTVCVVNTLGVVDSAVFSIANTGDSSYIGYTCLHVLHSIYMHITANSYSCNSQTYLKNHPCAVV